jgi:hypothetical protein
MQLAGILSLLGVAAILWGVACVVRKRRYNGTVSIVTGLLCLLAAFAIFQSWNRVMIRVNEDHERREAATRAAATRPTTAQ